MSEKRYSEKKKWTSPGSLIFTGKQKVDQARITIISYDKDSIVEKEISSAEDLPRELTNHKVNWVNVVGLHQISTIETIGSFYKIHPLVIEDILNVNHSPKYENYTDYIFVIAKMIDLNKQKQINIEQVSFILGKNLLITFQEDEEDVFDLIRNRLKSNAGRIRQNGADYLLYRLLDTIVDNYYSVLESMEDKMDELDEIIITGGGKRSLEPVYFFRRELMRLRRAVFPLQETIFSFEREKEDFIKKSTYLFFRDLKDHLKYVYETIETYREIVTGMIEVHMSVESRRLNEVIKVLTIISTIFIPLTFIVGVYGMNFNTRISKWNMPELNWVYGYGFVWIVMLIITALMIGFFKRKKWF